MATALSQMLAECKVPRGHDATHTSLAGGAYYIPAAGHDTLFAAYTAALRASASLALVEQHRHIGPVAIDLDFKAASQGEADATRPGKLYEPRQVARFVNALFGALADLVHMPDGTRCYVLEKPARCKAAKSGPSVVKDGLHIMVPDVVGRAELHHILRDAMLGKVDSIFGRVYGAPEAVYDEAVIERAGWLMYGSKKPDEPHAWTVTRVFEFDGDTGGAREIHGGCDLSPDRLVRVLSIRNKYEECPPMTPAGNAKLQAAVRASEDAHERRRAAEEARALEATTPYMQAADHGDMAGTDLESLVGMLAPRRATDYATWLDVMFCLNNITRHGEDGRALFHAFSTKAGQAYDRGACDRKWDAHPDVRPGGLGLGSLCMWAKDDAPDDYAAWVQGRRGSAGHLDLSQPPSSTQDVVEKMIHALIARWPDVFGGRLHADTTRLEPLQPPGSGGRFEDSRSGMRGTITATAGVWVQDGTDPGAPGRFLGTLFPDAPVPGALNWVHHSIPCDVDFNFTHHQSREGMLSAASDACPVMIKISNPATNDSVIMVQRPGERDIPVKAQATIKRLNTKIMEAVQAHARAVVHAQRPGAAVQADGSWFVAVINPTFNFATDPDAARHADEEIAMMVVQRNPDTMRRIKAVPEPGRGSALTYYYCDPVTNLWAPTALALMEEILSPMYDALEDGLLTPADLRHIKGRRGASDMLYMVGRKLLDPSFPQSLDAARTLHCAPFANGVLYDAGTHAMRPLAPDDLVSKTTGYEFEAAVNDEDAAFVRTFLQQVFPDPEERAYFLRIHARALFGDGHAKYFLVLTDERDGSNGKTTVMRAMEHAFGAYAAKTQREFLYAATSVDPKGHNSNLLAYKGARLAFWDEPDPDMKLDVRRFKDLTSGQSRQSGRQCGAPTVEEFTWEALMVLAANESNFPTMDSGDQPFLLRMKVLRMRSLFVPQRQLQEYEGEPHVFRQVEGTEDRLATPGCVLALLHEMAAAYRAGLREKLDNGGVGPDPPVMAEVREGIMLAADPRMDDIMTWVNDNVDCTPQRTDADRGRKLLWISKKELVDRMWDVFQSEAKRRKEKKGAYARLVVRAMAIKGRKCRTLHPVDPFTGRQMAILGFEPARFRVVSAGQGDV